ncbi:MAG: phosphatidate cytidylyltransferase, partial [Halanaerobiales bacterium]|nr:phosphatidate cytidylyltransferase [Halanaerobiales bacterium]
MEMIYNMLLKRIISSIIGILVFILIVTWGHFPFFLLISLITAVALYEFNKMTSNNSLIPLLISSMLFLIVSYLNLIFSLNFPIEYLFILVLLIFFYDSYRKNNLENIIQTISGNLLAIIYIVFGLIYFIYLRNIDFKFGLWIALVATWLTDIGAY